MKIGVDVGGTFTDFLVARPGSEPIVHKVLSTPADPSIGLINGLDDIARSQGVTLVEFAKSIETIVHGTTVTTNAVLTLAGATTGLLTTSGVRDALEMRRGVREKPYDNRFTNVPPLVPRHLRMPIRGRLDYQGDEVVSLSLEDVNAAIDMFVAEQVEAVAITFMNSFANPAHERQAASLVRERLPHAYLTVSSDVLPSIRFFDRVSSTVLNSYVGPKLSAYLDQLVARLREIEFDGVLLVMQSNGGVVLPEIAQRNAAMTLLSGPAAGPLAGLHSVQSMGHDCCITIDMGGTSFDAAMVQDGSPVVVTEGEINRYRIALPMLDIVTIGAGGGSIGWIDEGGLLRMGPDSAGADPGPACYGGGGTLPTCTDADLVLGYLDADFFAGGRIKLDRAAAVNAIEEHIAHPLGLSVEEAAVGMYEVINASMAHGVREVSIKRGFDPREFPLVAAGGAGPVHAAMICVELEIPMFVVPREAAILCATGMLLSDIQHDFVTSFICILNDADWPRLGALVNRMITEASELLDAESIVPEKRRFLTKLDCRYSGQYHEVSFPVDLEAILAGDVDRIVPAFHTAHRRLYGYALEDEDVQIELINVRLRATGLTDSFERAGEPPAEGDASGALKGERAIFVPKERVARTVPIYDGHRLRHGNRIAGPAVIEQVNTSLLLPASDDCFCDQYGSLIVYQKGREECVFTAMEETTA